MTWVATVGMGTLLNSNLNLGILCDWWWDHIWFSLVGSNWKWGQKWGSCQSLTKSWPFLGQLLEILFINLTYSRLVSWASRCTQVIGQNSIFIYGMGWSICIFNLSVWWSCMSPKMEFKLQENKSLVCLVHYRLSSDQNTDQHIVAVPYIFNKCMIKSSTESSVLYCYIFMASKS